MKLVHRTLFIGLAALLAFSLVVPALAQGELSLRISKTFGYSSFSGTEIQGTFSMKATGPEDLSKVTFYIDDQPIGEVTQAPFNLSFSTGNYTMGQHTLKAVGVTASGMELQSNTITTNFVAAGDVGKTMGTILIPLFVIIAVAMLSSFFLTGRQARKGEPVPLGAERKYGMAGGAICPRCQRPFAFSMLDINLSPLHRLSRCPHCAKFGVMRRRSLQELRAAEQAELQMAAGPNIPTMSEEDKLRKELESSRYQDN